MSAGHSSEHPLCLDAQCHWALNGGRVACPAAWDLLRTLHALTLGPTWPQPHRGLGGWGTHAPAWRTLPPDSKRAARPPVCACTFTSARAVEPCRLLDHRASRASRSAFVGFTSPLVFVDKALKCLLLPAYETHSPQCHLHRTSEVLPGELGWSALCGHGGQTQTRHGPEARPCRGRCWGAAGLLPTGFSGVTAQVLSTGTPRWCPLSVLSREDLESSFTCCCAGPAPACTGSREAQRGTRPPQAHTGAHSRMPARADTDTCPRPHHAPRCSARAGRKPPALSQCWMLGPRARRDKEATCSQPGVSPAASLQGYRATGLERAPSRSH